MAPEIALIDIYDSNTGTEAQTVVFNMVANATQTGVNRRSWFVPLSFSLELHNETSEH
jgi:hypothetical protein